MESKVLSSAAMNVTTFCFVFPNLIRKTEKKILMRMEPVFDYRKKGRGILTILRPFVVEREFVLLNFKFVCSNITPWLCSYVIFLSFVSF